MSFPYLGETIELNESTRKSAEGSFVSLTDGVTHYELGIPTLDHDGDGHGVRDVVLVHGFSVPYFIFDPTFDFLCREGLRVLRYDLFGRGWSDRPNLKYDIHLFVKQLADLLDALQLKRVNLLGLSMGGPISSAFTDKYPERVNKHVLIDPAGARAVVLPGILKALRLPLIGELALGLFGSEGMAKDVASGLFDPALVEEFRSRYIIQLKFNGFKRAILSTMRNGMLESFYDLYQRVGRLQKPTLLIWGRNDLTVPFEHHIDLLRAISHAEFHPIENCGHIPHYENPELVNRILKRFLEA